jgi:hypothetical protein
VSLLERETGVVIMSGTHVQGIEVVANPLPQHFKIDELLLTGGPVRVDAEGGDDVVSLRGSRFTRIDGGEGWDTLILNLSEPIDLGDFVNHRVAGFEEFVFSSDIGSRIRVNSATLRPEDFASELVVMRVARNQQIEFSLDARVVKHVMHDDEFAQVIEVGQLRFVVINAAAWQNARSVWDVNGSGDVTSLDALAVINQLARVQHAELPEIDSLDDFGGFYFDVTGDGLITSLDALRVINELGRRELRDDLQVIGAASLVFQSQNEEDDDIVRRDEAISMLFGG